ncbi:hypothetical protein ES702_04543 [subsurface metagenome]
MDAGYGWGGGEGDRGLGRYFFLFLLSGFSCLSGLSWSLYCASSRATGAGKGWVIICWDRHLECFFCVVLVCFVSSETCICDVTGVKVSRTRLALVIYILVQTKKPVDKALCYMLL